VLIEDGAITADKLTTGELITLSAQIKNAIITNAKIGSMTFDKITAATNNASLTIGSTGSLKGGATGYNAGTGFWMGYSSGYKFFIGNAWGNKMLWTGSALEVTGKIIMGTGSSVNGTYLVNGTIVAGKLNVTTLSAITANLGAVTAGTITGLTLQTAASGQRLVISPGIGTDLVSIYDASRLRAQLSLSGIYFKDSSGVATVRLTSGGGLTMDIDNIAPISISGNKCATTGGQWGLGYINVTVKGVARSIVIEHAH